jgi:hypothetical protein
MTAPVVEREDALADLESRCLVVLDLPDGPVTHRANVLTSGPGRALLALPAGTVEQDVLRAEATWVADGAVCRLDSKATVTRLRLRDLLALDLRHGPVPRRVRRHLRGPAAVPVALTALAEGDAGPTAHAGVTSDLSAGGMSMDVAQVLRPGPATALLDLPGGAQAVQARVVHSEPGLARVQFDGVPPDVEQAVTALCFRAAWEAAG